MKKITFLFVILLTAMMANISKVSAQTQLTTPTVGTATLPTSIGFTANWTPADANALSFDVKVYDATLVLVKTVNAVGAATATVAITGLTPSTAYTFTVTAKGDGTIFTNSTESAPLSVSTNAFITLTTPTVGTASRVTLTNFVANWTPVNNATSYNINVYDASNALVTGFPKNVTGATTQTLAITATGGVLLPNTTYTFTVTAKGDSITYSNSSESSKSASFTTETSGSFVMQYAAADAITLTADIKAGAAYIYELTESGGIYSFSTTTSDNNTIIRNTTIRAAAGLAAKPILKLTTTSTSGTANIFNTVVANITIRFTGLEFNGTNTATGGTQPIIFYAKGTASLNCIVYFTDCYIHDCLNASGNGVIRLDGMTGNIVGINTSSMYIKNCTFSNFGGRALYLNTANVSGTLYGGTCSVENSTFTGCQVLSSRGNITYNTAASGLWAGNITFNHCTIDNIAVKSGENSFRQNSLATGGVFSIQNCIFTNVQGTLTNATIDYSYIAGIATAPTGTITNTFAASPVPAYTDIATNNFRLTNAGSFICADGFIAGNTYNTLSVPTVSDGGTNVTTGGFTANWAAVINASSYDVRVYDSTPSQVGTTTNVAAGTLSLAITGLSSNANYTYTVTAIGDHITYFDSNVSAASVPVSTLVTGINRTEVGISVFVNGKTIVASEIGTMQVYNLQGSQLLHTQNVAKVNTNLASGLYVVCFTNKAGKQYIQKIAIQ
ncbi:MAG TPA: fibronectin type III domain-containing protein [Paludibacter sp.]